jgi:hypothetical protein
MKSVRLCAILGLVLGLGFMTSAQASTTWTFGPISVSTSTNGSWDSTTAIDPFSDGSYPYTFTITDVTAYLGGTPYSVISAMPVTTITGTGTNSGSGFTILNQNIGGTDPDNGGNIFADLNIWVDGSGFGHLTASNLTTNMTDWDFQYATFSGTINVVPEPVSLLLLSLGAIPMIMKKRA